MEAKKLKKEIKKKDTYKPNKACKNTRKEFLK